MILVFLKMMLTQIFSLPFSLFDPLLLLVIFYTFFHSMDVRDFIFYALFCDALRDVFSLDVFGFYLFSYFVCSLLVSIACRFIYRENPLLVFPIVFFGVLLNNTLIFFAKYAFLHSAVVFQPGWFLSRTLIEALGTTAASYPFFLFSKKCALEFTS
jgi:cell shape-determining protein MreD